MLRTFRKDDLPELVRLHARAFGADPAMPPAELARHFEQVLVESPWSDPDVPSLVWEDEGEVRGFLGVVPRPMCFGGERIRTVVTTQLMVDPEHPDPLTATRLTRAVFDTGYDLVLTDGASSRVLQLWRALGAEPLWLLGLTWRRTLRPARELADTLARKRPKLAPLARLSRLGTATADAAWSRLPPNRFSRRTGDLRAEPIRADTLLEARQALLGRRALRPHYDETSTAWLLERAKEKKSFGELDGAVLRDARGQLAGWHLYYTRPGAVAEALQVGARPGREEEVLAHLFAEAAARGAVAVRGGTDAALLPAVGEMHGALRPAAPWALAWTRRPEVAAALHRGDTSLARLDLEFWMRFRGG